MHRYDAAVLRAAALPVALVVGVCVLLGTALDGGLGALGALLAGHVVCGVFALTSWLCSRTRSLEPTAAAAVAVGSYVVKVVVLGVVLAVFGSTHVLASDAFPLTLIAVTMAWMAAEVRAFTVLRTFYVEPVSPAPATAAPVSALSGSAS